MELGGWLFGWLVDLVVGWLVGWSVRLLFIQSLNT